MPKLTKSEFARLMASMPGASEDEVVQAAQQQEQQAAGPRSGRSIFEFSQDQFTQEPPAERSMLGKAWDFAKTPLTTLPSQLASSGADAIDQRSLGESKLGAQLKGFAAGALQGVGDLASQMTSPIDLALNLVGAGGAVAGAKGALGISKAARNIERGLMAPLAVEGGVNAAQGVAEGDYTKAGMGALQAAMGGLGMKNAGEHSFPVGKVRDAYMKSQGRPTARPQLTTQFDETLAKRTADAYEALKHTPEDPQVKASYQALVDEVERQYDFVTKEAGVKIEPYNVKGDEANYPDAEAMRKDIAENNRLTYYPSDDGFGSNAPEELIHPMMGSGKNGMRVNDMFRAIHDYFGHGVDKDNSFRRLGERRAFEEHNSMMPDAAKPAMATETHGQNSWVHAGPHVQRNADGSLPQPGQETYAPRYADQKAGLLPEEFQQTGAASSATGRNAASPQSGTGAPSPSAPAYTPDEAVGNIAALHSANGGSTFNIYKGSLSGTPHYAVSVFPERGKVIAGKDLPPEVFKQFVQENADLLKDPNNSVGTWFNQADGKTYLDVSTTLPDLDSALKLGQAKGQLAIFDLGNFKEIPVAGQPGMPVGAATDVPLAQQMAGTSNPEFHSVHPAGTAKSVGGIVPEPKAEMVAGAPLPTTSVDDTVTAMQRVRAAKDAQRAKDNLTLQGGATALSVAAPAAAMAIPDDPNSKLDDYGRLGLNILGAGGVAALGMASVRNKPLVGTKLYATEGAGVLLSGGGKAAFVKHMVQRGAPTDQIEVIYNGSKKLLEQQIQKVGKQLTSTTKLAQMFQTGKGEMKWYDDTHKELQTILGKDADMVAGFLAATSINATVKSNTTLALKAYRQWKMGEPFEGYLPAVIDELTRVAKGERLAGRKLDNFHQAILGKEDAVVVDRWMMRAFGFKGDGATPHQYDIIESAVKQMAQQQGVSPRQMQASIWFAVKNAAEAKRGVRNDAPSYEHLIRDRFAADHTTGLKENAKFDKARKNPSLF